MGTEIDDFVRAYLECALWSSTDGECNPLDDEYSIDDCSPEFVTEAIKDCQNFRELCIQEIGKNAFDGWDDEQAGHDFWLTHNRHGTGFWDRGLANGDKLTKWAHTFGSVDLYVHEGKVHSQ